MTPQERGDYWHEEWKKANDELHTLKLATRLFINEANKAKERQRYYLIEKCGLRYRDISVEYHGPFDTEDERDAVAARIVKEQGRFTILNGWTTLLRMSIDGNGNMDCSTYMESELEEWCERDVVILPYNPCAIKPLAPNPFEQ